MIAATRLFVGNLPDNTQVEDLSSAFSVFGKITNLDLKSKTANGNENKKFAFISILAPNADVESCIQHYSSKDFNGNRLYVTRARESFLERLQRERQEAQRKDDPKFQAQLPAENPIIRLGDKLNPKKRKVEDIQGSDYNSYVKRQTTTEGDKSHYQDYTACDEKEVATGIDKKKYEAERRRIESMNKKRQEFKQKKMIIKTGLTGVDKVPNKRVMFTDNDESPLEVTENRVKVTKQINNRNTLFNDDLEDSDDELNFEVRKQFEGKKGQKVLDLQSRYKSDKRFTLDERFVDEEIDNDERLSEQEEVDISAADEKAKQLNILQDVLGVTLNTRAPDSDTKKSKPKLGMLRFNPMQPDHVKFLAPIETKPEATKKSKKKANQVDVKDTQSVQNVPKVEVSKEQFYKVSDTLKESIAHPNTFSLRSLFGNSENVDDGPQAQDTDYIPLNSSKEKKKVRNPLDPTEKNPFVYDSSDSETEEPEKEVKLELQTPTEQKAVWKENLFFSMTDPRLKDGLTFFSKVPQNEVQKERRELKSLVKKRIYNNDRKIQMFKKKIGGRKKSMKKPYKNKC